MSSPSRVFGADVEGDGGAFDGQQTISLGQVSVASWHSGGCRGQPQESGTAGGRRKFEKSGEVDARGAVDGVDLYIYIYMDIWIWEGIGGKKG